MAVCYVMDQPHTTEQVLNIIAPQGRSNICVAGFIKEPFKSAHVIILNSKSLHVFLAPLGCRRLSHCGSFYECCCACFYVNTVALVAFASH